MDSRFSPARSSLLVRNLPPDIRPEDLRIPFERYGRVKDVYLPKDFNTGQLRGFGFVKFRHADDAAKAKRHLDYSFIGECRITIVYSMENRKTPDEMRTFGRSRQPGGSQKRRVPSRSPRRRHHSFSRSPSPARNRKYRDDDYSPMLSHSASRSPLHDDRKRSRSRSTHCRKDYSRSPSKSPGSRSSSRARSRSYGYC